LRRDKVDAVEGLHGGLLDRVDVGKPLRCRADDDGLLCLPVAGVTVRDEFLGEEGAVLVEERDHGVDAVA
jgi:hypothetical protein